MNVIETVILGLVQGLTEFIPVSSSGHLVITQQLFSGTSNHLFLEFINIGTVIALILFFWKRLVEIIRDVIVDKNIILARNLIITSIPAGLCGFLLSDFIDRSDFFGSIIVVAVSLAIVGILMIVLEKLPKSTPRKDGEQLSAWRALLIGVAQILALIPGVSRSGSTIIAGRIAGLSPKDAAEYSFLASLPIMLGVTLKIFISSSDRAYFSENLHMLLLSNLIAFIAGYASIGFLLRYLSKHSLSVFGWYRVGLAACVLILVAFGTMK